MRRWQGLALVTVLMATGHAAEAEAFTAFAAEGGTVAIRRAGADYLRFSLAAWGPGWAWTGIEGAVTGEGGAAVARLTGRIGGTDVPFRVAFRAEGQRSGTLRLTYELTAERDTALTCFVVGMEPGPALQGRSVTVITRDGERSVACPFGRAGLGSGVSAVRLSDAGGSASLVTLSPPAEVPSDGAARIVLAADRLEAGAPRRLTVSVRLPDELAWYATPADIPQEPGLAAWYPWTGTGAGAGSLLGMEDWAEPAAGRTGRVVRQGDALTVGGKPVRLWGLNLSYSACAPEKAVAERRAALYRRYGVNAVRLHKWADGSGGAGLLAPGSSTTFDPAALDRMDYQVAQLKAAGIYVLLSANFGTLKPGKADLASVPWAAEVGQPQGDEGRIEMPHSATHYSPDLQRLQIAQTVNLLKHRNPYTGLTYAQDPAVAFVEIINEQSILFWSSMAPLKASASLRAQVGGRFSGWLRARYGSQAKLSEAWGPGAFDSFVGDGFPAVGESLEKGNILPLGNPWYWDPDQLNGSQAGRKRRLLDTLAFLTGLQDEFYERYVKAVREAGYAGELVASNWQAGRAYSHYANLRSDALIGTVDRHNYFGGEIASESMLARPGSGILSTGMQQVEGHPFMISEWAHVFPNEYAAEGPAIVGAYGFGLQGWDASFLFQNGDDGAFSERMGRQQWDAMAPPALGLFPAVARAVHRGDVRPATLVAGRSVHFPSLFQGELGFSDTVRQGYDAKELDSAAVPAGALATARVSVTFSPAQRSTPEFDMKPWLQDGEIVSSTGQLRWRGAAAGKGGSFTMATGATAAFVGFGDGKPRSLGPVTITPGTGFAAIYVTARDRAGSLARSKELLVVAIARARNTGQRFSPGGDRMLVPGNPPILMEPVRAGVTIRRTGAWQVFVLDHDGRPTGRTLNPTDGAFRIDGERDRTCYYLVRFAEEGH